MSHFRQFFNDDTVMEFVFFNESLLVSSIYVMNNSLSSLVNLLTYSDTERTSDCCVVRYAADESVRAGLGPEIYKF